MTQLRTVTDSIRLDLGLALEPYEHFLEIKNLVYQIGEKPILNGVDLHLDQGEVLAVVGPNGAGKSTLLKLLSSDLRPTSGDILLEGLVLTLHSTSALALKRAVMSQQAIVTAQFTAREVVKMGRYPHHRYGRATQDEEKIINQALERTETTHLAERLYPTLSGGEGARITLARVLAQETPLLLLDEPTAALDLRHQQIVMQIARELAERGAAVLLIVHDLNLASAYAHRIAMLQDGRIFADGTPCEVLTEDNLQTVFNLPVQIMPHPAPPHDPCPLLIPLQPHA